MKQLEEARRIINYWYNMEYYAPFFPKKKDGDIVLYGKLEQGLPWIKNIINEKVDVYIGNIKVDNLLLELHNVMKLEDSIERENAITCIGKIELNQKGKYVKESFKVCNFLFAVTCLINAKRFDIEVNQELVNTFNSKIDNILESNYSQISEKKQLLEIETLVLSKLNYRSNDDFFCLLRSNSGEINKESDKKINNADEDEVSGEEIDTVDTEDMLNSFYAKDLSMVLDNIRRNDKIIKYINAKNYNNKCKIQIDKDVKHMKRWTSPYKYPMAKWPSKFSPSLMQQIAINIAISEENEVGDIFSVNGPPGTGKTTLLKEIIANNIVERAIEITKYENPNNAFKMCQVKNPPNDYYKTYYEFPDILKKYSIVVASNNNSAVENISLDLPNASDVEENKTHTGRFDINTLEEVYFSDVATKLCSKKAWGLISARLGNKKNLGEIRKILNTNKGHLLEKYFTNESKNIDWDLAKRNFIEQYNKVIEYREGITSDVKRLYDLKNKKEELNKRKTEIDKEYEIKEEKKQSINEIIVNEDYNLAQTKAINESIIYIKSNLSFFEKLLLLISKKSEASQNLKELSKKKEKLLSEYSKLHILKTNIQNELLESVNIIKYYEEKYQIQRSEYEDEFKKVKSIENKYKTTNSNNFAEDKFFEDITNNNISQKACPWTNDEYDKLREELFYRALILQKSFVQNAKGIKQNIRMLCKVWGDDGFYTQDKQEFFKHTFATLFLLIPVISTTFASVGQLLKYIGKEELGTLIIDESGQAMPQSAIGALWRTRKAIVVGDPLQVEPVVTSSRELSKMFINQLSINPGYGSKELSVQELADLTNPLKILSIYSFRLKHRLRGYLYKINDNL